MKEEDKDVEGLVKVRVVRFNEWEVSDDEEEEEKGEGVEEEKVLDVDDSVKDVIVEGGLEYIV